MTDVGYDIARLAEDLVEACMLTLGPCFLLIDPEDLAASGGDQFWGLPRALQGGCCHRRCCPWGPAQAEGASLTASSLPSGLRFPHAQELCPCGVGGLG